MYLAVEAQTERATHVPPTSECGPQLKIRGSPPNLFFLINPVHSGAVRKVQGNPGINPFMGTLGDITLTKVSSTVSK